MSGLCPHNHGALNNNQHYRDGVRTLAEYLPPEYATAYYGKWHLGNENKALHGFRDWRSLEDIYRKFYTNPADLKQFSDYHNFLLARGYPPDGPDNDSDGAPIFSRTMAAAMPEPCTKVAFLANEAGKFLQARRDGKPFVLYVNSLEPHAPTYGPLNGLHDPAAMPAGPAFANYPGPQATKAVQQTLAEYKKKGYKNHPISSEADWRRLRANYYGLVSMVDNAYARVRRALEASGQADNTIVVYTSDHGDMCGDHCLMGKGNFYEGSVHVPLAIHVPWLSRRRVDYLGPISSVDLVPTLLDLLQVENSGKFDGVSRAGALRQPGTWRAEDITCEWNDVAAASLHGRSRITSDGWKLNLYQGGPPEFFDLKSDPGELRNVAGAPAQRDRFRRLTDELRAWQQATRDTVALTTG